MKNGALEITWAEEKLALLPERALWWPRQKTLFIADPHFGKAATFRLAGLAVPETSHDDDLTHLEMIVRRHRAGKLVVLGDFFHAKAGRNETTLNELSNWRDRHPKLEIILVMGNHDRHAGRPPAEWKIDCVKEPWPLAPFSCCHRPQKIPGRLVLCGHVHPAFQLYERSGLNKRAACFYFQKNVATLPAFGNFTGMHTVEPECGERIFLVTPGQVIDASKLLS
jgi:uncharacterized protein